MTDKSFKNLSFLANYLKPLFEKSTIFGYEHRKKYFLKLHDSARRSSKKIKNFLANISMTNIFNNKIKKVGNPRKCLKKSRFLGLSKIYHCCQGSPQQIFLKCLRFLVGKIFILF